MIFIEMNRLVIKILLKTLVTAYLFVHFSFHFMHHVDCRRIISVEF